MKRWFTSDTHFGHANILKYCLRPFKDVHEMNDVIIRKWNERVKPEDEIFHLGDVAFYNTPGGDQGEGISVKPINYLKQLRGKIYFIKGNHDKTGNFKTCVEKIYINYGGHRTCLVHNPIHIDWTCPFNFVGHVHQNWKYKILTRPWLDTEQTTVLCNVGVDVWSFYPVSYEEIMKGFKKWKRGNEQPVLQIDHPEARLNENDSLVNG